MALTKIKGAGINISATEKLYFDGGGDTYIHESAADVLKLVVGGVAFMDATEGTNAIVFNEGSVDMDFRVESNGNANMLFVDGGNDRVGIGTASPESQVEIQASSSASYAEGTAGLDNGATLFIQNTDNTAAAYSQIILGTRVSSVPLTRIVSMNVGANDADLAFVLNSSEAMRIDGSTGNVGIGETSLDGKLHIKQSTDEGNAIVVDSGTDGARIDVLTVQEAGNERWNLSFEGSSSTNSLTLNSNSTSNVLVLDNATGAATFAGTITSLNFSSMTEFSGDMDDLKKPGFYRIESGASNAPSATYWSCIVFGNGSNVTGQIVGHYQGTGDAFWRGFNTSWGSWRQIEN